MSTVVIIEDVKEIGDILSQFVNSIGFESVYAQRFSDVAENVLSNASHILLDLNIPEYDGLDILEALSEQKITCPIILCTGMPDDIIQSTIDFIDELNLCFGGTLQKPFTYDEFIHTLKHSSSGYDRFSERFIQFNNKSQVNQSVPSLTITENDLKLALSSNYFFPVFQPQIDISSNRVFGVECLARLTLPIQGVCPPTQFINKLVEYSLIEEFTLNFTNHSLTLLNDIGFPKDKRISINIDPHCLHTEFISKLKDCINSANYEPNQICFEITESSRIKRTKSTRALLTKLRLCGFHISLDDFGTGFSTLYELDKLPFDEVKIDKSFINQLDERVNSLTIVKNTISLGKELGKNVIAEGVETKSQVEMLLQLECTHMQGYFFSKPLGINNLNSFLRNEQFT